VDLPVVVDDDLGVDGQAAADFAVGGVGADVAAERKVTVGSPAGFA